jgi:biopolymer transport protein ExbD
MSRFSEKDREVPELTTSSLPDLIFTILFFFMIVTSMREVELKVQFKVPQGTELERLEKKSEVSFIYIGPPVLKEQARYGQETRVQLNDKYAEPSEILSYIGQERQKMAEPQKMTVSIKADVKTKMGTITDVKQMLRKAYALRINYSASKRNGVAK